MIRPEEWIPSDGLKLEPNAFRAATEIDRNVIVSAGPGAGKTELLAQRADFLFRTGACPYPRRILAISFKVDAAQNLLDRVRARSGPQYASRFDSFTFHAFAKRVIDNYRPALTGSNSLAADYRIDTTRIPGIQVTFNDLISLALEIIRRNQYARNALRQTYSHVFLDEFQDTTPAQYDIVKSSFYRADTLLTAVGDINQRIMAWAGALDGIMQTFADDFDADSLVLYQNFRSAPRLRRLQNRMVRDMDPSAASPNEEISGDSGTIQVLHLRNQVDEAEKIANLVDDWLRDEIPPNEIAILVRQQSKEICETLSEHLHKKGISFRNEQDKQDLTAEPVASLILNYLWVVVADRRPEAYSELIRVASQSDMDDAVALQFDSRLKRFLRNSRIAIRSTSFDQNDIVEWRLIIDKFLDLVSRPALIALSPAYQQDQRLDQIIDSTISAFGAELRSTSSPIEALRKLSDLDSIKIMTIHKCKGLEFRKVIILGVEKELFWGKYSQYEFFVAISRAKEELILTHVDRRGRPSSISGKWDERRTAYSRFLTYANDDCTTVHN